MINRKSNVYIKLPDTLVTGKTNEAKATISVSLVLPKSIDEKKGQKFIETTMDEFADDFKKFIKKQIKKLEERE